MHSPTILEIPECPGLLSDAFVLDMADHLAFLSVWGRDTAIQEFLGRCELSTEEGGLSSINLVGTSRATAYIGGTGRLKKYSGRMPKANLFGDLNHVFVYDRLFVEHDKANRRAMRLYTLQDKQGDPLGMRNRLWEAVCELCHLPLLPHWRDSVLDLFERNGWVEMVDGHHVGYCHVDLSSDHVDHEIENLIRIGSLAITS